MKLVPPYFRGANKSKLFERLDAKHCPTITPAEVAILAMWTDLGVPFCGTYPEAGIWSEQEQAKYKQYWEKRQRLRTP